MRSRTLNALFATAALAVLSVAMAAPAQAAGCGGYVNVFVSGCAPWDNNPRRMPGAPGYQAPRPTATQTRVTTPTITTQVRPQTPMVQPNTGVTGNRLITDNGAGIISNDGGGLRARGNILSDQGGGMRR